MCDGHDPDADDPVQDIDELIEDFDDDDFPDPALADRAAADWLANRLGGPR